MKPLQRLKPYSVLLVVTSTLSLSACNTSPSVFNLESDNASAIATFSWLIFAVAGIVFISITLSLMWAIWRNRTPENDDVLTQQSAEDQQARRLIIIFGAVIPAAVLLILMSISVFLASDSPALSQLADEDVVRIQVIGHNWWWEVHYPDHNVITANEIYIPVSTPVRFYLTTDDVIHSFWLPQIQGKLDMLPGETNEMTIQVNTEGIYEGFCAEYCGMQHAQMRFQVIVVSDGAFNDWLEHQAQPAPHPDRNDALVMEGYEAFMGSACVYCHTIRGTAATGVIGPDLTHIASRNMLASNTIANNHGNLMGWILNSQTIKPGNYMPPMYLDAEQVDALIAYLETLD